MFSSMSEKDLQAYVVAKEFNQPVPREVVISGIAQSERAGGEVTVTYNRNGGKVWKRDSHLNTTARIISPKFIRN